MGDTIGSRLPANMPMQEVHQVYCCRFGDPMLLALMSTSSLLEHCQRSIATKMVAVT